MEPAEGDRNQPGNVPVAKLDNLGKKTKQHKINIHESTLM